MEFGRLLQKAIARQRSVADASNHAHDDVVMVKLTLTYAINTDALMTRKVLLPDRW